MPSIRTGPEPARTSTRPAADPPSRAPRAAAPVTLAVMLLAVVVGLLWSRPPRPVDAGAPATEFSAARAGAFVDAITRAPHPVGTAEHERVRAYLEGELRRLGFEVQTQATTAVTGGGSGTRAATVRNVAGRLRGERSTGAVLLMAHYDAVPFSFGAADDGAGVAAILEAMRALRAGPAPANDVIVLFSDAEEVGLLGAGAFVEQHPWAKDVGMVLNFEGRGHAGPVLMFETSRGNGRLVATAAGAARHARGSSLMVEIYRLLPNDTDLSVFLRSERGYPSLNFAFIGGHTHYHTPLDRRDQLGMATLQHHGDYALSLARAFGNADLRALGGPDHVYFDVPLVGMVHYPAGWAPPIAVLAALAAVGVVIAAFRRRVATAGGAALGLGALLLALLAAAGIAIGGWKLVTALAAQPRWILQGDVYNADAWLIAFAGLVGAVVLAIHALFRRRASAASLLVAPLLAWAALAVLTAVALPGGSYLFSWPLLFAAGSALLFLREGEMGTGRALALALCAAPTLALFAPLVRMFETALGFPMLAAPMVVTALVLALLVPQLDVLSRPRRWAPPLALLATGMVALAAGFATSGFGAQAKKPNSVAYLLDADSAKAYWYSVDPEADEWTRRLLGDAPRRATLTRFGIYGDDPLVAPAPTLALAPPEVRVVSDSAAAGGRRVRLRVATPRGAERLSVFIREHVAVSDVEVNGHRSASPADGARPARAGSDQRVLTYYAVPPEGIELAFTVSPAGPLTLRVTETSYGLPPVPGGIAPRPEWMMSKPFVSTDVTQVSRAFSF